MQATDQTPAGLKITPMFEQYLSIKQEYPNALLFFRMGDFYELFFTDAEKASRELQITLTSRNSSAENPIPMCGVPYHAAESYINQLLEKGYTVAVCDQMEDPKAAKGLVKRAVTCVRTPSTAVEDNALEAKNHTYLGSLYWNTDKNKGGFAWLDYSTGAWSGLYSKSEAELFQWIEKIQPRELLLPDFSNDLLRGKQTMLQKEIVPVRLPIRNYFDLKTAIPRILKAQRIQELAAIGLEDKEELTQACGALLAYLVQTQKQEVQHLTPFTPLSLNKHLIIDELTERNLEIFRRMDGCKGLGTLIHVLDETLTPMGGRLLTDRLRHPWRDLRTIQEHADTVTFFFEDEQRRANLRTVLKTVYDMERLSTRIAVGRATPRDFTALKESLIGLNKLHDVLINSSTLNNADTFAEDTPKESNSCPDALQTLLAHWDNLKDISSILALALVEIPPITITEGGIFRQGYDQKLDTLLDLLENGEKKLQILLQEEQEKNNLPKLKLGYNRVFGYFFELSKSVKEEVPAYFIRKQTVANAERFITPDLKELEEKILAAGDERNKLEYTLFQELRTQILNVHPRIIFMAAAIAALDYWQSLAETASKQNWVRPLVHEGTDIIIRGGRHPVVEATTGPAGFIPNDLYIDDKRRMLIITGPNMAGKSTVLRQVAIIVMLAQIGSFVPAIDARIGTADRIFSRVGASDNLALGQSTFMVEMMETARILRQASKRSLVILDEIGRGTSTFDGLALAWAVVESLAANGNMAIRTLFATHYHELTALEGRIASVHNMNIAVREQGGEILFTRRLIPGPTDRSYGIEVAKLAGVPQPVVQRAKQILFALEQSRGNGLGRQTTEAMQQLLPGMEKMPSNTPVPKPLLAEKKEATVHPLCTTLQNLDTNNLTPMQALTLINEWKLLWGMSTHDK